jgi:hypothetical protein
VCVCVCVCVRARVCVCVCVCVKRATEVRKISQRLQKEEEAMEGDET